jgi:serine/threonine-protein kinase
MPTEQMIDSLFPGYTILEPLSSSEMSDVFLASKDGERYVIKAVKDEPPTVSKDILMAIDGPSFPKFIDIGKNEHFFYCIYKYIPGVTLTEYIKKGVLPPKRAVTLLIKLCEAIGTLHSLGIMHMDLKPENIIVSGDNVSIIDFGIIKKAPKPLPTTAALFFPDDDESGDEGNGTKLFGSFGFRAPELGYLKTNIRADIYSLGRVLFYCLTGSRELSVSTEIDDPALLRIIKKATNYFVAKRYKDTNTFKKVLKRYLIKRRLFSDVFDNE